MDCADHNSIAKHAIKEIAWQQGRAATFLPKWHQDRVGSSSHVHQSLWKDGEPAFCDPKDALGMSELMRHYMAGLITYAPDYTYFLAPYVNSYKRFSKGTFAPTKPFGPLIIARQGFGSAVTGPRACAYDVSSGNGGDCLSKRIGRDPRTFTPHLSNLPHTPRHNERRLHASRFAVQQTSN